MIKRVSLVVVAMLFSASVAAAGKVVVFNMQAAILQSDVAKKRISVLESNSEYAALKSRYEGLRADLESMQKDAATNSMVWTDEQKAEHRKKMEYQSADFKLVVEKLKAERNGLMQLIMQEQGQKAKAALEALVKAENIGLVMDSSVAYWADADSDITGKITAKLNQMK